MPERADIDSMTDTTNTTRMHRSRCLSLIWACLSSLMLFFGATAAHAEELPANLQAAILFKVLSYDGNIASRPGTGITVFIVTDKKTEGRKNDYLAGFKMIAGKQIGGKAISVQAIGVSELSRLENSGSVIYLPAGSEDGTISKALEVAVEKKIATFGGSEALVKRGSAVGLEVGAEGKPEIVINLNASKKQGMKLSSRVLGLARVIDTK